MDTGIQETPRDIERRAFIEQNEIYLYVRGVSLPPHWYPLDMRVAAIDRQLRRDIMDAKGEIRQQSKDWERRAKERLYFLRAVAS